MPIDNREIYDLSRDFGQVPARAVKKIRPIVSKTSLEVKRGMQADFRASTHFKPVARSVDYDVQEHNAFGSNVITSEIGPNKTTDSSAALAGIGYFGSSRGGGGTVRDPVFHARDQGTKMVGFIEMAIEGLL